MKTARIIFFGTPAFAAEVLLFLVENKVPIAAVVTQPDRPKGRSLVLTPSPVKLIAQNHLPEIPVFQPEKASDPQFLEHLKQLGADLYVVVAFGQILTQTLLDIPPLGCINVHASLLPKYRGAAPIHRCLLNGDTETGVSIQKMVRKLDAGDVIAESSIPISPDMNFGELEKALCELSKTLLLKVLDLYAKGIPPAVPQDPDQVSFAAKVEPEEGELNWSKSAQELHNLVRAFSPRPGAWCWVWLQGEKKRLKIFRTEVAQSPSKDFTASCASGFLKILEVQPEGKPRMSASDWLRGLKSPPSLCRDPLKP